MPRLPFEWRLGQHIALVGDTGTGKTTVAQAILAERRFVTALRSKPDDLAWPGYKRSRRTLPDMDSPLVERLLLEPRFEDQWREFAIALDLAFKHGNWTVFIDDLPHVQEIERPLFLLTRRLLIMGRSMRISVLTAQQRPVDVTRYAIAEARITISFMLEGRDVVELAKSTSPRMGEAVGALGEHDVAMYHRPTRDVWVGRLDLASGEFIGEYVGELRQVTLSARAGAR